MNATGYGGQRPGYEAPACVQNAMMTKDKKPFTYTPGGIDLSQIKSERMAKRLARNAQDEGAGTGAAQQNRPSPGPAGTNGTNVSSGGMGAAAMGMPFQVLPPPPPPPPGGISSGKQHNGSTPAPPPPPSTIGVGGKLVPPNVGSAPGSPNMARKSPTPQRFEPPPMGFRPEIKIPPNPMAALRKVPPPVEKNTFWKDEYVKERSKSPMPGERDSNDSQQIASGSVGQSQKAANDRYNEGSDYADGIRKPQQVDQLQSHSPKGSGQPTFQQQQQQQNQYTPSTMPGQDQRSPHPEIKSVPMPQSPTNTVYTRQSVSSRDETDNMQRNPENAMRFAQQRTPMDASPQIQSQQTKAPPANEQSQTQTVPWRTQRPQTAPMPKQQSYQQPTTQDAAFNKHGGQWSPQQQQAQTQQPQYSPAFERSTQPANNQGFSKPTSVGSLYIAPLEPNHNEPQPRPKMQQQLQQQQRDSPIRQAAPNQSQQPRQQPMSWMTSQPPQREQPEWVRPEENGNVVPSSLHRLKSPPPPQKQPMQIQQQFHHPQNQSPFAGGYEAMSSGMPQQSFAGHTSSLPATGLRLQINTSANQQSSPRERIIPIQLEQTPPSPNFNAASPGYIIRSPNQFVDQGYNNFPPGQRLNQGRDPNSQRVMTQPQQLNSPRMVQQHQQLQPGEKNARIVPISIERGRNDCSSQSTVVLPNDPRSPPIQSKSFRILQKITDTTDDEEERNASKNTSTPDAEPQLHRPQFSRQMSAQQARNSPTVEQMRRMNIGHTQDVPSQYIHPSEQQVYEPKKYTGSAIPSKSFKILQAMTTPENAGPGQSDL